MLNLGKELVGEKGSVGVVDVDLVAAAEEVGAAELSLAHEEAKLSIMENAANALEEVIATREERTAKGFEDGDAAHPFDEATALTAIGMTIGIEAEDVSVLVAGSEAAGDNFLTKMWNAIKEAAKKVWDFLKSLVSKVVIFVKGLFGKGDVTSKVLEDLADKLEEDKKTKLGEFSDGDKKAVAESLKGITLLGNEIDKSGISSFVNDKEEVLSNDLSGGYIKVFEAIKKDAEELSKAIEEAAKGGEGVFSKLNKATETIKTAVDGLEGRLPKSTKDVITKYSDKKVGAKYIFSTFGEGSAKGLEYTTEGSGDDVETKINKITVTVPDVTVKAMTKKIEPLSISDMKALAKDFKKAEDAAEKVIKNIESDEKKASDESEKCLSAIDDMVAAFEKNGSEAKVKAAKKSVDNKVKLYRDVSTKAMSEAFGAYLTMAKETVNSKVIGYARKSASVHTAA